MARKLSVILALALVGILVFWFATGRKWPFIGAADGLLNPSSDAAITDKVKSAFALSKRLAAYDIQVATKEGVVTLSGQIPTEIDQELAENVAKDVIGVKQVDNQLAVELNLRPSEASARESARVADLEIRANLRERLAASEALKGQDIQLSVQERVVTLTGQVATPQQKEGAEQVARSIANVNNVVNQLNVGNPLADAQTGGIAEMDLQDRELKRQAEFALFNERENFENATAIKVESKEGAVTLTGTVASRAERALAEHIVREVKNVARIVNQLTVAPPRVEQPAATPTPTATPAPARRAGRR